MKGAIFDFDGTLVDTMPLHYEAYRLVFARHQLVLTRAHFFAHVGGSAKETIPRFVNDQHTTVSVDELHAQKKQQLAELLETHTLSPLQTAKLLPVFAAHMPVALASSGSRPGIDIMLTRLGWHQHFKVILTGEDVTRGKPAPDLFLLAAQRIDVRPAECLVFEDTDDGIKAAQAAGMQWFDVRKAHGATT